MTFCIFQRRILVIDFKVSVYGRVKYFETLAEVVFEMHDTSENEGSETNEDNMLDTSVS